MNKNNNLLNSTKDVLVVFRDALALEIEKKNQALALLAEDLIEKEQMLKNFIAEEKNRSDVFNERNKRKLLAMENK